MLTIAIPFLIFSIHNPIRHLRVNHIILYNPLLPKLLISMHKHIKTIFVPLKNKVCRAPHYDTRLTGGNISYNLSLSDKQFVVRRNSLIHKCIVIMIQLFHQAIGQFLFMLLHILRRITTSYSRQVNQFTVIKGDTQLISNILTNSMPPTTILTSYGDHKIIRSHIRLLHILHSSCRLKQITNKANILLIQLNNDPHKQSSYYSALTHTLKSPQRPHHKHNRYGNHYRVNNNLSLPETLFIRLRDHQRQPIPRQISHIRLQLNKNTKRHHKATNHHRCKLPEVAAQHYIFSKIKIDINKQPKQYKYRNLNQLTYPRPPSQDKYLKKYHQPINNNGVCTHRHFWRNKIQHIRYR